MPAIFALPVFDKILIHAPLQKLTALEKRIQPSATAILSKHLPSGRIPAALLERWEQHALIQPDPQGGHSLTTNAAWLAGNMIAELQGES